MGINEHFPNLTNFVLIFLSLIPTERAKVPHSAGISPSLSNPSIHHWIKASPEKRAWMVGLGCDVW